VELPPVRRGNISRPDMLDFERLRNRDLLKRFRAGDREAFTEVYRAHYPAVFRFALHMTADRTKAAEVTQDVFVWLIHHAADYDPDRGELAAFLTGVTRKLLQRRRHDEQRWVPFDEAPAQRFVAEREPDTSDADRLRVAIAALPERYREVVALCDLEGKSYEDAAGALECAVGTVRSRLHRARGLLARKLQDAKEVIRCSV
jgi:RNA polymerase sigma-70 factor (ECF subfamily)